MKSKRRQYFLDSQSLDFSPCFYARTFPSFPARWTWWTREHRTTATNHNVHKWMEGITGAACEICQRKVLKYLRTFKLSKRVLPVSKTLNCNSSSTIPLNQLIETLQSGRSCTMIDLQGRVGVTILFWRFLEREWGRRTDNDICRCDSSLTSTFCIGRLSVGNNSDTLLIES